MAMGTRKGRERQQPFWMATNEIVESPGNAFYDRLNQILNKRRFDIHVERLCRRYYNGPFGRQSLALGGYSDVVDRLLRRARLRTRHWLAGCRLAFATQVSGLRTG